MKVLIYQMGFMLVFYFIPLGPKFTPFERFTKRSPSPLRLLPAGVEAVSVEGAGETLQEAGVSLPGPGVISAGSCRRRG